MKNENKHTREEREAERFADAEKVSPENYDGPVFWDGGPPSTGGMGGDGFYFGVGDLRDSCAQAGVAPPVYVWTCFRDVPSTDTDWLIEDALQEHHEGARDWISAEHMAKLEAFLRQWWAESNAHTWRVDYKRAVVLTPIVTERAAR